MSQTDPNAPSPTDRPAKRPARRPAVRSPKKIEIEFYDSEVPQCPRCKKIFETYRPKCPSCGRSMLPGDIPIAPTEIHALAWVDRFVALAIIYYALMCLDVVVQDYQATIVEGENYIIELASSALACWYAVLGAMLLVLLAAAVWLFADRIVAGMADLYFIHVGFCAAVFLCSFMESDLGWTGAMQLLFIVLLAALHFGIGELELPDSMGLLLAAGLMVVLLCLLVPWATVFGGLGLFLLHRKQVRAFME